MPLEICAFGMIPHALILYDHAVQKGALMIRRTTATLALAFLFLHAPARAIDIEGVQPAALDQPRVSVMLKRDPKGKPLAAKSEAGALGGLLGQPADKDATTINIQAFLDTGASGIMLSGKTAEALVIKHTVANRDGKQQPVIFHDIGVGGTDQFQVSEKLFIYMMPDSGDTDDERRYTVGFGPVRAQISQGGGLIEMLTGGLDVMGMPAMKGRVIAIDPTPVNKFDDTMKVKIFAPRDRAIPQTDLTVKLTYVNFSRFTSVEPATSERPVIAANPMIGPDPTLPTGAIKNVQAVIARHNNKEVTGTWLLDTGAAASMISTKAAALIGVTYVAGTEGSDKPRLHGVPEDRQFTLSVGGVGGTKKSAGFFMDQLVIPTSVRHDIVYKPAPVLVTDISVEDPKTKQRVTLDGVFGMNFMCASAFVSEAGLMPDIKNMTAGPYDAIVFDEPMGELRLKLSDALKGQGAGGQIQITPAQRPQGAGRVTGGK